MGLLLGFFESPPEEKSILKENALKTEENPSKHEKVFRHCHERRERGITTKGPLLVLERKMRNRTLSKGKGLWAEC